MTVSWLVLLIFGLGLRFGVVCVDDGGHDVGIYQDGVFGSLERVGHDLSCVRRTVVLCTIRTMKAHIITYFCFVVSWIVIRGTVVRQRKEALSTATVPAS